MQTDQERSTVLDAPIGFPNDLLNFWPKGHPSTKFVRPRAPGDDLGNHSIDWNNAVIEQEQVGSDHERQWRRYVSSSDTTLGATTKRVSVYVFNATAARYAHLRHMVSVQRPRDPLRRQSHDNGFLASISTHERRPPPHGFSSHTGTLGTEQVQGDCSAPLPHQMIPSPIL